MSLSFADQNSSNRYILLVGPPKQGKTIAACTLSDFCPEVLPAKEVTYLKDTLVGQFDPNGVESCRSLGIIPYLNDMSTLSKYQDILAGLSKFIEDAKALAASVPRCVVILDTLSNLDQMLITALSNLEQFKDPSMMNQMYGRLLTHHRQFFQELRGIKNATIIGISHVKAQINTLGAKGQENFDLRNAATNVSDAALVLDVSGRGGSMWKNAADGIFPIRHVNGKYLLYPYGVGEFEGGSRFVGLDPKGEPADLKKLFAKVAATRKQMFGTTDGTK